VYLLSKKSPVTFLEGVFSEGRPHNPQLTSPATSVSRLSPAMVRVLVESLGFLRIPPSPREGSLDQLMGQLAPNKQAGQSLLAASSNLNLNPYTPLPSNIRH